MWSHIDGLKPVVSNKQCNKVIPVGSKNRVLHEHLHAGIRDEYTVTFMFKHNVILSNVVG